MTIAHSAVPPYGPVVTAVARPARPADLAAAHVGGWALIVAALGFVGVFGYLAARFDYPAVLDGAAADVLPRLLTLGAVGRSVWAVYAMIPLLLLPAAVGAHAVLRARAPGAMRAAVLFAVLAAFSMTLGLARWPSVHWELARAYADAGPESRTAIAAVFAGLNVYLGQYLGEFLGELCLNAFFLLSALAALRSDRLPRWVAYGGAAAGVVGVVAAFRNVTALVAPVADVNTYLLPIWLLAFGVALVRARGPEGARAQAADDEI
jgi:hypothetical protein